MGLKNVVPLVVTAVGCFVTNDGFVLKHQFSSANRVHNQKYFRAVSANNFPELTSSTDKTFDLSEMLDRERENAMAQRFKMKNESFELAEVFRRNYDNLFLLIAVIPPVCAFIAWPEIAAFVATIIGDFTSNYRNVDGNAFAVNLLRPTINGVVVPALAIGGGTLLATTVNVLRTRQVDMRRSINKEVCELRLLRRAILGMFSTRQHARRRAKALRLLLAYTQQLVVETRVGAVEELMKKQSNGGISENELDELAEMLHGIDGAAASRQGSVAAAEGLIVSLNGHRSDRVATLLSGFPRIHYGILATFSLSICFAFLIESNQEILQFLNSIQLRCLFAILIATVSSAAALCADLNDPFRGSFCISLAAEQLQDFSSRLEDDISSATADAETVPTKFSTPPKSRQTEYGATDTAYFHLLTGPLAANTRVGGELVSFCLRCVSRMKQFVFSWFKPWRAWMQARLGPRRRGNPPPGKLAIAAG